MIINQAKKQSERYRVYAGKFCPEYERPGFYIEDAESIHRAAMRRRAGAATGTGHRRN